LGLQNPRKKEKKKSKHHLLTLKAKPARQLVDNADLIWPWSAVRVVFVLKARPSWAKLKRHE